MSNAYRIGVSSGGGGGGDGGGTPDPGTYARYALLTATSTVPTAAEFLAGGITSQSSRITVPAYTSMMYLHFWDRNSSLSVIQQVASDFNGRLGFLPDPTELTVDGNAGYVYSSRAARFPVGERTWRLEP